MGLRPEFEVTVVTEKVRYIEQRLCTTFVTQCFHEVISQVGVVDALGVPLASVRFKVEFRRCRRFEMLDEATVDHDSRLASDGEGWDVWLQLRQIPKLLLELRFLSVVVFSKGYSRIACANLDPQAGAGGVARLIFFPHEQDS